DHPPSGREFADDAARAALAALAGPYLPWGAGAMRPAGLVAVCNDVVLHARRRIVELGSGISTVLLARLLHQRPPRDGFRLVAIEHDPGWVTWVTEQVEREGLDAGVSVLHAPLAAHPTALDGLSWYDARTLDDGLDTALEGDPIDLLLVDGPPAYVPGYGLARYPALPVLRRRMARAATIVLDDVERAGELDVLRRWEHETGIEFDRQADRAGVAVARLGGDGAAPGPRHG
ncbi:MAG: class I SAM-dependent methyltransferase, partial [Jiangellaceae bacterium]